MTTYINDLYLDFTNIIQQNENKNKSGIFFEQISVETLKLHGLRMIDKNANNISKGNYFKLNAPYKTIYMQKCNGTNLGNYKSRCGKMDILIISYDIQPTVEFPNIIPGQKNKIHQENKMQISCGTVESKHPETHLNLKYSLIPNTILLMGGLVKGQGTKKKDGFTPNNLFTLQLWCAEQNLVDTSIVEVLNKIIRWMNMDMYIDWTNRAFSTFSNTQLTSKRVIQHMKTVWNND